MFSDSEQAPLLTIKAHIFQVDPETRKSWVPLSNGAVNVQIFHDSVKNVYRILSVDGSKVLLNTIVTARMTFTKTSQKFCQWVDSRANHVYGLGVANENDLLRFVDKFLEVKEATRNALRSSSVDARQTPRSDGEWSIQSNSIEQNLLLKQENTQLKLALAQSSTNAKKWQDELEILRNNNAKLTTALQESHGNVEEWKRQLHFYRDECSRLRQLISNQHLSSDTNDSADLRNKEQEQKIFQLENQIQRYVLQMSSLKERITEIEADNQGLRNEFQRRASQDQHSPHHRNLAQINRLRELFESKSNDFQKALSTNSQDLQNLCSQITQALAEF